MAYKETMDRETLMSEATWNEFHSEPKEEQEVSGMTTFYTKGDVNLFTHTNKFKNPLACTSTTQCKPIDDQINNKRDGWYGWMGVGGSIF